MSANPLFEKWLFEWRESELERGSNMHFPYAKAIKTLQKCPVQLQSGSECLLLKNFGQSIVDRLDYKLAAYRRMHPSDETVKNPTGPPIPFDILKPQHYTPRIKYLIKSIPKEILKVKKPRQRSQSAEVLNESTNSPRKTREYCPKIHSGPYAILIAMLKEKERPSYLGFMTKAEIIERAQPYCDASLTRLENGRPCAAWAGVNTLCKKSLVTRWSNPAKFNLTENGEKLARELIEKSNSLNLSKNPNRNLQSHLNKYDEDNISDVDTIDDDLEMSLYSPSTNSSNHTSSTLNLTSELQNHLQMYDEDNISDAETIINDDLNNSLLSTFANSPNQFFAFSTASSTLNSPVSGLQIHGDNIIDADMIIDDTLATPTTQPGWQCGDSIGDQNMSNNAMNKQIVLYPGNYEIVLLINRQQETMRTLALQELRNLDVKFEERSYNGGFDFLWVARSTDKEELLMPYAVQREGKEKPGCSSGRSCQQKLTLKKCGVQYAICLMETFESNTQSSLSNTTIGQDLIAAQLTNEFFKTVNGPEESMLYLSQITHFLRDFFKDKIVASAQVCYLEQFSLDTNCDLFFLATFKEFSEVFAQRENTMEKEIENPFVKALSLLEGITAEKANLIVKRYPNPSILTAVFASSNDPENLLSDILGPSLSKSVCQLYYY